MVKDLSVRDPVPPTDMEEPVQAIDVKPVVFLDMPAVHSPCVTAYRRVERTTALYTLSFVCAERPSCS